jgi:DNA polymerase III delta prime subunit
VVADAITHCDATEMTKAFVGVTRVFRAAAARASCDAVALLRRQVEEADEAQVFDVGCEYRSEVLPESQRRLRSSRRSFSASTRRRSPRR